MKLMKYIKKATALTAAAAISITAAISASAAEDASFFDKGAQKDANGVNIGYADLSRMDNAEKRQALYNKLVEIGTSVYNDTTTDYSYTVSDGETFVTPIVGTGYKFYSVGAINISDYYPGTVTNLSTALKYYFSVYNDVLDDNPLLYMFDYSAVLALTETDQGIALIVGVDPSYAKAADRVAIQEKIKSFYGAAEQKVAGLETLADKHAALSKYLLDNMTYAFDSEGHPSNEPWAHNIVGPAVKQAGVCESYARSYELLCNFAGMSGKAIYTDGNATNADPSNPQVRGGHAWNNIILDDGKTYGQDLTWDDQLTEQIADLVSSGQLDLDNMAEAYSINYHDGYEFYYFGRGKSKFFLEHAESNHNTQTQYLNMFLYEIDQIAGVVRPDYDYYILGDVNNDFTFNMKDLIRLGKYTVTPTTPIVKAVANADGAGEINMADAVYLQKSLLGYENTEPNVDHDNYPTRGWAEE